MGRKTGVIILISKNIPYTIQATEADAKGCRVSVTKMQSNMLQTPSVTITNIYAPNNPTKKYFTDLATWFFQHMYTTLILGGDFNPRK